MLTFGGPNGFAEGVDYEIIKLKNKFNSERGRPKLDEPMINYGFVENVDYQVINDKNVIKSGRGRPKLEHAVTSPMAKEVCMIQNNVKGEEHWL